MCDSLNKISIMVFASACSFAAAPRASGQPQPVFRGLTSELPAGTVRSGCACLSPDGRAVGISGPNLGGCIIWHVHRGVNTIPTPSGYSVNTLYALSTDGLVAAGFLDPVVNNPRQIYRYHVGNGAGYEWIASSSGGWPLAGSDDLGAIVYNILPNPTPPVDPAYLWRQGRPTTEIPTLPGGFAARAMNVSGNGLVVVGGDWAENTEAWRWTGANNEPVPIGDLPGGLVSAVATACSHDGSVIAGYSSSASCDGDSACREAFVWRCLPNKTCPMIPLGDLPGGRFDSRPTDMTADGSIIVGNANTGFGTFGVEAFIWDAERGMRDLRVALMDEYESLRPVLQSWRFISGVFISANGRVIAGNGLNPAGESEAWVVYLDGLPNPGCPADFNADGLVNTQDFFDYLVAYFTQNGQNCGDCESFPLPTCPADFNRNCFVNTQDFFDFLTAFLEGCP